MLSVVCVSVLERNGSRIAKNECFANASVHEDTGWMENQSATARQSRRRECSVNVD